MSFVNISDVARSLISQNQAKSLRSRQPDLMKELTNGVSANPVKKLRGDLSQLASLNRFQSIFESYAQNNRETAQWAQGMQVSLESVVNSTQSLFSDLSVTPEVSMDQVLELAGKRAIGTMDAAISSLNISIGGRYLFSGTEVATAPLASTEDLLTGLDAAVAGSTNLTDIEAAIESYFDVGGGFEAAIYQGGASDIAPINLDENETTDLAVRADDASIRDVFKAAAYAYVAASDALTLTRADKTSLVSSSRSVALEAKDNVIGIQSRIGVSESRIEDATVRLSAAASAAEQSKLDLIGVDKFEAASRLEDVNTNLELVYAATVRISGISFLEFMR
ncbi:flagellin [Primorskyibacter sp. S187A]|uniref:flagellin n=1 Tax=Primorskyibacter sp. S187A TaxID=3415130 RepID=UPI003C7E56C8